MSCWDHLDKKMDTDDPEHISWLYKVASKRAKEFKIEGVTWQLTQGVVKNIIPAIASTNAIIAASCCNEAFKIATTAAPFLNNYWMLIGTDGVYSYTFEHEKKPDCPVCGGETMDVEVGKEWTVERLIEWLTENQKMCVTDSLSLARPVLLTKSQFCETQTNQETLSLTRYETDLLPSATTIGGINPTELGEEGSRFDT